MKKIVYSLFTLALLFTSCAEWDDPKVESYAAGPSIDVVLGTVTDNSISFTLQPVVGATFYSYALYEGTEATIDATLLLKTTGGGVSVGCFNAAEAETKAVTVSDLSPNTDYVIYAVACSDKGIIGAVSPVTAKTTDTNMPAPASAVKNDDGSVSFTFSEAVTRGEGIAYAKLYKEWDLTNPDSVAVEVTVEGATVTISAPEAGPGAYVAYNWEAGAFIDEVNLKCAALRSYFDLEEEEFTGVVNHIATGKYDIVPDSVSPEAGTAFADWNTFYILINLAETHYVSADDLETGEITLAYINDATTTTTNLTFGVDWVMYNGEAMGESGHYLSIKLPSAPVAGDLVTVFIEEGFIYDAWGNVNDAFFAGPWKASKGYTIDMIYGNYSWDYVSYWAEAGETTSMSVVLEEDPEVEDGIIMKNMLVEGSEVYGIFDGESGLLVFPDWQVLYEGTADDGSAKNYMFSTYDTETVTFEINADGSMVSYAASSAAGFPWMIYVVDANEEGLGFYDLAASDVYLNPVAESASAPAFRKSVRNSTNLIKKTK